MVVNKHPQVIEAVEHSPLGDEPWPGPQKLAVVLGIPVQTLYAWHSRGEGPPAYKIGRHLRYRPDDVEAWLAERRMQPAS